MNSSEQQYATADVHELASQNIDFVRRLVVGMLGASQTINDLVQDVFVKVLRGRDSFRGEADLKTWIYRITTRVIYDHLDSLQNRREHYDEAALDSVTDHHGVNAETQLQHKERNEIIQAAVTELSPALRMAVALSYFEGLSAEQIAEIEGCTPSTVYWRLHEAKKQLKPKLAKYL
jgi:RNA polymerase sigma factor, sigma-70 family